MTIIMLSEPIPFTITLTLFGVMTAYISQSYGGGNLIVFRTIMALALTIMPVVGALWFRDVRVLWVLPAAWLFFLPIMLFISFPEE